MKFETVTTSLPTEANKLFITNLINIAFIIITLFNVLFTVSLFIDVQNVKNLSTEIRNEQINRTKYVYSLTSDRLYRTEMELWLSRLTEKNPELIVPALPKIINHIDEN